MSFGDIRDIDSSYVQEHAGIARMRLGNPGTPLGPAAPSAHPRCWAAES